MDAPAPRAVAMTALLAIAGAWALAVAAGPGAPAQPDPAYLAAADGSVLAEHATPHPTAAATFASLFRPSAADHSVRDQTLPVSAVRTSADGVVVVEAPAETAAPTPTPPTKIVLKAKVPASPNGVAQTSAVYKGVNHVWIPALGISRSVAPFPCDRVAPPDNLMYRWGCAGRNNVYLLGHAYAPLKPLYDAYTRGTLRVGMRAVYADGAGHIHTYAVIWWKVTLPTTAASWAWAAQSVPSMTLQTCVGAHSEYRLMVRLQEVAN